jgi:uncharacterized membrane protein YfhO
LFKLKLQQLRKHSKDPRILVILAPIALMAPVWATGKALYWGTPSTQFIPWWHQAFQTLREGQLPLWNPLLGMGAPLLANYQSALLYPPNWIYFLLAQIGGLPWMAWGMAPMIAAHLAWAGLGTLLLIRRLGMGVLAQSIGGLAFGLSGYLVARAHFLSINAAVAWLPWILLAAYNLVQKPNATSVLKLSLILALQWLAGHAQISWYSLILLLAWTVFWIWQAGKWSALPRVGGLVLIAGGLALALSAIQLLPTAEYLLNSQRASQVESQIALSYSFWPWRFLTLLSPNFFGSQVTGDYWGFANFWEDAVYIGLLPFLLAVSALFKVARNRKEIYLKRFLLGTVIISFLLALGSNTSIYPWLYRNIPSFNMFQAPTRFSLWGVIALALLAAMVARHWQRPIGRGLYWARLAVAAAVSITLTAYVFAVLDLGSIPPVEPSLIRATIAMGLIAIVISVLNLVAPKKGAGKSELWTWAVVLFLTVDLIWAGWGLSPGIDMEFFGGRDGQFASLREDLGEGRLYISRDDEDELKFQRFFRFDRFEIDEAPGNLRTALLPNLTLLEGIPSVNNFDPLVPARYRNWMDTLEGANQPVKVDLLARMGVTVIESVGDKESFQEHFSQIEGLPRLRWYPCANFVSSHEKALGQIAEGSADPSRIIIEDPYSSDQENCESSTVQSGQVEWISQSPNHLRVSAFAPDGGWLLLADTWYPGWRANIDGQEVPIYPADAVYRAVRLPEGEHQIEISYRPLSFVIGATLSAVAWLGLPVFWRRAEE